MHRAKDRTFATVVMLGGLLAVVLLLGCGRWHWAALEAGPGRAEAADSHATGKQVFAANCARCHSVRGDSEFRAARGAHDALKGQDLAGVGADPDHSRQWLMDYIRDPQAENRVARMPKFGGKIAEGDLLALADYLASLKGN